MGFGVNRFADYVEDILICNLCGDVLHNPLEISSCGHLFCEKCIKPEIAVTNQCPVDGKFVTESDLTEPPKAVLKMLSKMEIKCDFEAKGCECVQRLDLLEAHVKQCRFNSDLVMECPEKCGAFLRRETVDEQFPEHGCIVTMLISDIKETTEDNRLQGLLNVIEKQHRDNLLLMKRIPEMDAEIKELKKEALRVQEMDEELKELKKEALRFPEMNAEMKELKEEMLLLKVDHIRVKRYFIFAFFAIILLMGVALILMQMEIQTIRETMKGEEKGTALEPQTYIMRAKEATKSFFPKMSFLFTFG